MMEHISGPVSRVIDEAFVRRHIEHRFGEPIRQMQADIVAIASKPTLAAGDIAILRRLSDQIDANTIEVERAWKKFRGTRR